MSLDTALQNGDTVEIMSTKSDRGPSLDWLNPNRGYVRSAGARQSIRQWFNRQRRETNIRRGREILRREMRRLNQKFDDSEVLSLFKYDNMDELLANLGSGSDWRRASWPRSWWRPGRSRSIPWPRNASGLPLSRPHSSGITVQGVGDMLTRMGPCCNPIRGR